MACANHPYWATQREALAHPTPTTTDGANTDDANDLSDKDKKSSVAASSGMKRKRVRQSFKFKKSGAKDGPVYTTETDAQCDCEDVLTSRPIKKSMLEKDITDPVSSSVEENDIDEEGVELQDQPDEGEGTLVEIKPKKNQAPRPNPAPAPPDPVIRAFIDGVANLKDWTSSAGIDPDICQLIAWLDRDGISAHDAGEKWRGLGHGNKKNPGANQGAGVFKNYDKYAPKFYKEKGIVFVRKGHVKQFRAREKAAKNPKKSKPQKPRTSPTSVSTVPKRSSGAALKPSAWAPAMLPPTQVDRPAVRTAIAPGDDQVIDFENHMDEMDQDFEEELDQEEQEDFQETDKDFDDRLDDDEQPPSIVEPPRVPTADEQLELLFIQTFPAKRIFFKEKGHKKPVPTATNNRPSEVDTDRFDANRISKDVLTFKCKKGDVLLGHPSRPVLDRQAAAQFSTHLKEEMEDEPQLEIVEYGDDIKASTITRYIACISPCMRNDLPTHDIVEYAENAKPVQAAQRIEWSMDDLLSLYRLAHYMGTTAICDMIIDHLHEDLHRRKPRTIVDEFSETSMFNILDFGPEFVNNLVTDQDAQDIEFFADIIICKKEIGLKLLKLHGMQAWDPAFKNVLKKKLEELGNAEVDVMTKSKDKLCERYHHHWAEGAECYRTNDPCDFDYDPDEVVPTDPNDLKTRYWRRQIELQQEKIETDARAVEAATDGAAEKAALKEIAAEETKRQQQPQYSRYRLLNTPAQLTTAKQLEAKRREEAHDRADRAAIRFQATKALAARVAQREQEDADLEDHEDTLASTLFCPTPLIYLSRQRPDHNAYPLHAEHDVRKPQVLENVFYPERLGNGKDTEKTAELKRQLIMRKKKEIEDFWAARGGVDIESEEDEDLGSADDVDEGE